MSVAYYRFLVIGSAASWFFFGVHVLPLAHQVVHHGQPLGGTVLTLTAMLGVMCVASSWALLRTPAPPSKSSSAGVPY